MSNSVLRSSDEYVSFGTSAKVRRAAEANSAATNLKASNQEENRGVEGALDDWFSRSASLLGIAVFYQFIEQISVKS